MPTRILLTLTLLLATLITVQAAHADTGSTVTGVVHDNNGDVLPGVTLTLTSTADPSKSDVAYTEATGEFKIERVAPGSYKLAAELEGFARVSKDLKLVGGQILKIAFTITPAFGETVEVVGKEIQTGEVAVLESRREAPVVSDSISSEEMRKTPDSNAAAVVERLAGVTLVGDKYVFVRGLGERYSSTTLNGATLATTETDKRVVPLDLFPAKLLENVNVVKTYTPDKPGDFGSGVVEMNTIEFPTNATLRFSLGGGYVDGTTGGGFRRYASGLDAFGRGGQPMPSVFPSSYIKRKNALGGEGFTAEELQTFGRALTGDWTGKNLTANPATEFALAYGNSMGRLGMVLSAVSTHKFATTTEELRYFGVDTGGVLVPRNDFALTTDRESVTAGFIANLSYRLSDTNRLFLNSLLTRDAGNETRVQQGDDAASGGVIRGYRSRYQIEQITSGRLRGEHNLAGPGVGSLIEWSLAQSRATNDSDLRDNLYRETGPNEFSLELNFPNSGETDFFNLKDKIRDGGASYTLFFARPSGRASGSVETGVDLLRRTRDFGSRRFHFESRSPGQFDLTQSPDEIFVDSNITPTGLEIREVTGFNDAYDAEHEIRAGFVMADATTGRWRFIGGARYEESNQTVTTYNPFDTSNPLISNDDENSLLPSLNVVYSTNTRSNLRAAYSRTVNRPEFRELSPFSFVEVVGGRSIVGNPELKQATLDNYDVRWEVFPGAGQVYSVSVFYKAIDRPIERIVQPTSDLRTSFVNADAATLYGAEFEFKRDLEIFSPSLRNFAVNFNLALIESDVTVGEQDLSVVTSTNRPLAGQANQSVNLALQYYRHESGTLVRLLGSYIGRRLSDVGVYSLPDIYEEPYKTFDFVLSQRLDRVASGLEIKFAAIDVLSERHEFTQAGLVQQSFSPGRTASLTLGYSPF